MSVGRSCQFVGRCRAFRRAFKSISINRVGRVGCLFLRKICGYLFCKVNIILVRGEYIGKNALHRPTPYIAQRPSGGFQWPISFRRCGRRSRQVPAASTPQPGALKDKE